MAAKAVFGGADFPMDFGSAEKCARRGVYVRRAAWRRGAMVFFVDAKSAALAGIRFGGGLAKCGPDGYASRYSPTQADREARDWRVA